MPVIVPTPVIELCLSALRCELERRAIHGKGVAYRVDPTAVSIIVTNFVLGPQVPMKYRLRVAATACRLLEQELQPSLPLPQGRGWPALRFPDEEPEDDPPEAS